MQKENKRIATKIVMNEKWVRRPELDREETELPCNEVTLPAFTAYEDENGNIIEAGIKVTEQLEELYASLELDK